MLKIQIFSHFFDYFWTKNSLNFFKPTEIESTRQGLSNGVYIVKHPQEMIFLERVPPYANLGQIIFYVINYTSFESTCRVDSISVGLKKF
jgi:hypothetical protein